MKRLLVPTLLLSLLASSPAAAYRTVSFERREVVHYYYWYPAHYYTVQYPAYVVVAPPRWSVGLHVTGLSTTHKMHDESLAMGGGGMHLRTRGYRFGAELALDVIGKQLADGGIARVSVPIQASGMFYLLPWGRFNIYALAGLRVVPTNVRWDLPNLSADQSFVEFGGQAGLGAELHLSPRVSLTGDVRGFATLRNSNDPAGKFYKDLPAGDLTPVPEKSAGVQVTFGASLRF